MRKSAPFIIAAVLALAGCASSGTTGTAATSSAPVAAATSASPAASVLCRTNACIARDISQSLVGLVAKDNSVMTKASCKAATVKHNAGDTYTARCTVHYSDGSVATGYGNLLVGKDEVTFQPENVTGQ